VNGKKVPVAASILCEWVTKQQVIAFLRYNYKELQAQPLCARADDFVNYPDFLLRARGHNTIL